LGNKSHLLAVSPADGHELWKAPMPDYNMSYSTPVVWKEKDGTFAGMTCATRFSAFRLADGKEAWWVNDIGWQACSTPVVAGDELVIAAAGVQGEVSNMTPPPSFDEVIKKYDGNGDGLITPEELPKELLFTDRHASQGEGNMPLEQALQIFVGAKKTEKMDRARWDELREKLMGFQTSDWNKTVVLKVRTGGKQDVTESQVLWKETKGVPEVPSPLIWDGRIYMIRSGGLLACRDLASGKLIYEERIESPGGYFASPVVAGGKIYMASDHGVVTVVKAGEAFEVLSRNELNEPIFASPVIVDGTLYMRSKKQMWAFAEKGN
jgi:outer membrane protein assembly factor BamB